MVAGSPIVVFLDRRARVDVLRDGRILSSAIYEAGNQQLDTSNLPEGSYEIQLRVEEGGRRVREERRFYTKSGRIPSEGRTDFFVYGGLLADEHYSGTLKSSGEIYLQGGVARRLGKAWALDGTLEVAHGGASVEMGATVLTRIASLRTAAIASDRGTFGTVLQLSSSGGSRFNFNVDFRRIENREHGFSDPLPRASIAPATGTSGIPGNFATSSYTQVGGVASYSRANARFLATAFYRDEKDHAEQYSIGPSVEWDVMRRGPLQVTLRSDLTMTERGTSGFAGVSLRLIGKRSAITAVAGSRTSGVANDTIGSGLVAGVTGAWNVDAIGGQLSVGSGYEHQPLQDELVLSSQFRHPLGTVTGDLLRNERDSNVKTQYALGFQTKIIAGAGLLRAAGGATSESLIVARVPGARDKDRFEVLLNEQIGGVIKGPESLALPLPAYRAYKVRIRPVGETLVSYDASIREVGLYPGSVASVEWKPPP